MNFLAGFMLLHIKNEGEAFALLVRTLQVCALASRFALVTRSPDATISPIASGPPLPYAWPV